VGAEHRSESATKRSRKTEASLPTATATAAKTSSHARHESKQLTCPPPKVMFTGVVADSTEKVR